MKIFVTGGTGFVGQYVVRRLHEKGHDLLLLTRRLKDQTPLSNLPETIRFIQGDLLQIEIWEEELRKFKPDVTLHLAWEGIPNYNNIENCIKNVKQSLNLFHTLTKVGCKKIICTGSLWEYGRKSGELKEDFIIKPQNVFTAAKNTVYQMGKEIARVNKMEFIWARLFYVYGPRQKSHSLIQYIIDCINSNKDIEIKTPYSKNDFVYVEDVADALLMILEKGKDKEIYNIGSGYSVQVKKIIDIIYKYYNLGEYNPKVENPGEKNIINYWADISKIRNDTGWEPKTNIDIGIKKTIDYAQKK